MPYSNRGRLFTAVTAIFVAVLTFLVVKWIYETGAITAVSRHQAESNTRKYAADAQERIESDCLQRQPAAVTDCVREIIEATNEHKRGEDDLVAQGDMALWAFWMVVVSVASVGITGIGVVYVALTLREARETTQAAVSTANAASHANRIAERNALRERMRANQELQILRDTESPHVFVENVRAVVPIINEWFDLPEKEIPTFVVHYDIANYGRSPAIITEKRASIYIGSELPDEPVWYPADISTEETVIAAERSRKGRCFYRLPITHAMLGEIGVSQTYIPGQKPTRVILFGQINYRGVNGTADEVRFCFEYRPPPANVFIPDDKPGYSYRRRRGVRSGYTRDHQ